MPYKITELDKKIFEYLLKKGRKGVPQNVLWKELGITSRDASRSLKKLEALGIVKRKEIVYEGRKTFLVKLVKKDLNALSSEQKTVEKPVINFKKFLDIPCMYCPYIDTLCYEGGYYDPRNCEILFNWIKEKIRETKS
jgi:DNA-binding Lrp family transcriptional regulator